MRERPTRADRLPGPDRGCVDARADDLQRRHLALAAEQHRVVGQRPRERHPHHLPRTGRERDLRPRALERAQLGERLLGHQPPRGRRHAVGGRDREHPRPSLHPPDPDRVLQLAGGLGREQQRQATALELRRIPDPTAEQALPEAAAPQHVRGRRRAVVARAAVLLRPRNRRWVRVGLVHRLGRIAVGAAVAVGEVVDPVAGGDHLLHGGRRICWRCRVAARQDPRLRAGDERCAQRSAAGRAERCSPGALVGVRVGQHARRIRIGRGPRAVVGTDVAGVRVDRLPSRSALVPDQHERCELDRCSRVMWTQRRVGQVVAQRLVLVARQTAHAYLHGS